MIDDDRVNGPREEVFVGVAENETLTEALMKELRLIDEDFCCVTDAVADIVLDLDALLDEECVTDLD